MPSQDPTIERFAKRTFTMPLLARSLGAVLLRLPVFAMALVWPADPARVARTGYAWRKLGERLPLLHLGTYRVGACPRRQS